MTILIFLAILVLLILVHEFGHFIVAKKSGIRVDEFGIGFPPKIWGKKFGETEYTLNWLPIGGFVRIWGEDPTEEHLEGPDSERSFVNKPRYIQAAVLVAGVGMNVLLAYVLYVAAFMVGMPVALSEEELTAETNADVLVSRILPESPAEQALKTSDEIIALESGERRLEADGSVLLPSEIAGFIGAHGDTPINITVERRGEPLTVTLTPETGFFDDEPQRAGAGFEMSLVTIEQIPLNEAIVEGAVRTYDTLISVTVGLATLIGQAVQGTADYNQIAGLVGIVGLLGDAASLGLSWLLIFTAVISLNLAVLNILPIPALDGGRLVFVIIEAITRRNIKPAIATRVNQIGFMALLALMLLVTINDVARLF